MTASLAGFLLAQQFASTQRRWMLLGVGRGSLGSADQGSRRRGHPGRGSGHLQPVHARLRSLAQVALEVGLAAVPGIGRALALARSAAAPRLSAVFFRARAFRALLDAHRGSRRSPGGSSAGCSWPGTVPWTVPALRVLVGGWRAHRAAGPIQSDVCFCGFGWCSSCVFFSLSDSKLMPYILPAMPALALLIGAQPPSTLKRDFLAHGGADHVAGWRCFGAELQLAAP